MLKSKRALARLCTVLSSMQAFKLCNRNLTSFLWIYCTKSQINHSHKTIHTYIQFRSTPEMLTVEASALSSERVTSEGLIMLAETIDDSSWESTEEKTMCHFLANIFITDPNRMIDQLVYNKIQQNKTIITSLINTICKQMLIVQCMCTCVTVQCICYSQNLSKLNTMHTCLHFLGSRIQLHALDKRLYIIANVIENILTQIIALDSK